MTLSNVSLTTAHCGRSVDFGGARHYRCGRGPPGILPHEMPLPVHDVHHARVPCANGSCSCFGKMSQQTVRMHRRLREQI